MCIDNLNLIVRGSTALPTAKSQLLNEHGIRVVYKHVYSYMEDPGKEKNKLIAKLGQKKYDCLLLRRRERNINEICDDETKKAYECG